MLSLSPLVILIYYSFMFCFVLLCFSVVGIVWISHLDYPEIFTVIIICLLILNTKYFKKYQEGK